MHTEKSRKQSRLFPAFSAHLRAGTVPARKVFGHRAKNVNQFTKAHSLYGKYIDYTLNMQEQQAGRSILTFFIPYPVFSAHSVLKEG
jgi:hypothetical protein